ncbi:MAG TPA: hypothetical protein VGC65_00945 [Bacteroidia bacterium]
MNKIYFLSVFLLVLSLFSCKKDEDEFGPKVTFSSPVENQSFNVYDYVSVTATVTDDTKIETVSVSLTDANQAAVHITVPVSVSSPSMTLNMQYLLDNIHLESGFYYVTITASDGAHHTNAYRKIYITAAPKVLKQIYLVSSAGSAQTNLSTVDSTFSSISPFHVFTGDYLGSSLSSYHQQAYVCGNYTGDFTALILQYNTNRFSITSTTSSNPYFTGYANNDLHTYIARYDGSIRGYDYAGTVSYAATALAGSYAQQLCFNSGYLVAEQKDKLSSSKKLVTYFPTGSAEKNCMLSQDVVAFCEKDNTNVFVFGNVAGQGVMQLFDRINNNLWSPYPFPLPAGSLLSAVKIDADTYLLGLSDGTIYKYQYSLNSVTTYISGYTAVKLKYDELNNKLYVVEANRLTTFNYSTAAMANTINSVETIQNVHLLYNR